MAREWRKKKHPYNEEETNIREQKKNAEQTLKIPSQAPIKNAKTYNFSSKTPTCGTLFVFVQHVYTTYMMENPDLAWVAYWRFWDLVQLCGCWRDCGCKSKYFPLTSRTRNEIIAWFLELFVNDNHNAELMPYKWRPYIVTERDPLEKDETDRIQEFGIYLKYLSKIRMLCEKMEYFLTDPGGGGGIEYADASEKLKHLLQELLEYEFVSLGN